MDEFVKQCGNNNYKLLTSKTDEEIICPDKDIMAQAQADGSIKITFLKRAKIINR